MVVTAAHPPAVGPAEWPAASDLREGDRVIGNSFTTIDQTEQMSWSAGRTHYTWTMARNYIWFTISIDGPHCPR